MFSRASVAVLVSLFHLACSASLEPSHSAPAASSSESGGGLPVASGTCPSEEVRASTACGHGPSPSPAEYNAALAAMQTEQHEKGVLDYKSRSGVKKPSAPRPLLEKEKAFIEVAQAVTCRGTREDGTKPIPKEAAEYNLGKVYFEASHWEEAATIFHAIALDSAREGADFAAALTLESIDALAKQGRDDCAQELPRRAAAYVSLLCETGGGERAEMCARLRAY